MRKLLFFSLLLLPLLASMPAQAAPPPVVVMEVKGPIVPVVGDYLKRGLKQAQKMGATAVVVQLNTPGGLVSTTQGIIEDLLASPIPVVVYVSPAGGWAGSAGAFITQASHVAAMAPGTFIGAAHPVTLSPSGGAGELPAPVEEKTVNALASTIRSIAQQRKRNVEVAEDMVRKSVAKTDQEALELGVVDLLALDLDQLLEKLEGREVELLGGKKVTLRTQGVPLHRLPMTSMENSLLVLSNPNIAYILLSLAMLGIFVELTNPGAMFPGIIGGIFLFLGLYSLGMLQASWAGLLLMALAFALLIAEVFVTSHGLLGAGGVASLIGGSLLLFSGSPVFIISPWLIGAVALGLGGFFLFALKAVIRTHRQHQTWGREGMVGISATAHTPLAPQGTVRVWGELWQATIDQGSAEPGEEVIITAVEGMRLRVRKKEKGG